MDENNNTEEPLGCPRMEAIARSRTAGSMVHLLARAAQHAVGAASEELRRCGLSVRQLAVLDAVGAAGPMMQNEIGALLAIDRTSMVALIDRLSEMGLVVRECHPSDRRANAVTLTDAGRAIAGDAMRRLEACERSLLSEITEAEAGALKETLRRLISARGCDAGRSSPATYGVCEESIDAGRD